MSRAGADVTMVRGEIGGTELRRDIVAYYAESQFFYDRFWTDSSTWSMNYGYWRADTWRLRDAFRNQNIEIAAALDLSSIDLVLEAGCGNGGAVIWMARTHGVQGVGLTLCPNQAMRGRALASEANVADRVAFCLMDYTAMAFPGECFTKVFASESVCYARRKSDFVREAYRVLRPGGCLVVVDGFRSRHDLSRRNASALARWTEGWAVPGLASVDEFRSMLERAGFRDVVFRDYTACIMPSARRIWLRGCLALPWARAAYAAGLLTDWQYAHVRSSVYQYEVWRRRIAVHGMFAARK